MRILHVGDDTAAYRPCGLTLYSEALMRAQVDARHEVGYVFSGRHYPWLERPRLKRRRESGIRMFELIGSPNHAHPAAGTREPLRDLDEPVGESAFMTAVSELRPDIVHVHELGRLPSSIIVRARSIGLPVVMTLHDYKPLCASVRLLDADGQRCLRQDVGEDCARNCAGALSGRAHLIEETLRYERGRLKRLVPGLDQVDLGTVGPLVGFANKLMTRTPRRSPGGSAATTEAPAVPVELGGEPPAPAPPQDYQQRRDTNLARLALCDRLIAPSSRAAEIYAALGVDDKRMVVQRLTLAHLERLWPLHPPGVHRPIRFVTVGSCASFSKGSRLVTDAVERLEDLGLDGHYHLTVLGHAEPSAAEALSGRGSVTLAGPYRPADLATLLDGHDVGILPSVWEETHGFVGIEMLASGVPLIGNALGGVPEYVLPGRTGWLNSPPTGAALASLMRALIESPDEVERVQRAVRARRHEIVRPLATHVAEVEALYQDVLEERRLRSVG